MTALIHSNQISMLCFICVRLICMHILSYAENKQKVSGSTILTQDLDPLEHYATCPKDARIYISVWSDLSFNLSFYKSQKATFLIFKRLWLNLKNWSRKMSDSTPLSLQCMHSFVVCTCWKLGARTELANERERECDLQHTLSCILPAITSINSSMLLFLCPQNTISTSSPTAPT
jgi:hypothetical protein